MFFFLLLFRVFDGLFHAASGLAFAGSFLFIGLFGLHSYHACRIHCCLALFVRVFFGS